MNNELLSVASDCVNKYLSIAKDKLGVELQTPHLDFNLRGIVAGKAWYCENKISINLILFAENKDSFLVDTIPHEVAHLVAHKKWDRFGTPVKPHGDEWKYVMQAFGCEIKRCHNYDMLNSQVRTRRIYTIKCPCRTMKVSKTIIDRMQGGQTYYCKHCKQAVIRA